MMPNKNNSIKSFKQVKKLQPASNQRVEHNEIVGGVPHVGNSWLGDKRVQSVKDDITTPLKQIGMLPQYMIQEACRDVGDLPRAHMGRGLSFNKSKLGVAPVTGMDRSGFKYEDRVASNRIGFDPSQKPFRLSTW